MKHLLYIITFLLSTLSYSQNFYLKITGSSKIENQIIDSINYNTKHPNIKSLNRETTIMSEKLNKMGYLDNQTQQLKQINDSTYSSIIHLKKRIKEIHIYIGTNNLFSESTNTQKDTIIIPYYEVENFLNQKIIEAEKKGFALSK